jgi:hypothetical protein
VLNWSRVTVPVAGTHRAHSRTRECVRERPRLFQPPEGGASKPREGTSRVGPRVPVVQTVACARRAATEPPPSAGRDRSGRSVGDARGADRSVCSRFDADRATNRARYGQPMATVRSVFRPCADDFGADASLWRTRAVTGSRETSNTHGLFSIAVSGRSPSGPFVLRTRATPGRASGFTRAILNSKSAASPCRRPTPDMPAWVAALLRGPLPALRPACARRRTRARRGPLSAPLRCRPCCAPA